MKLGHIFIRSYLCSIKLGFKSRHLVAEPTHFKSSPYNGLIRISISNQKCLLVISRIPAQSLQNSGSQPWAILDLRGNWPRLELFLFVITGRGATGFCWVRATDAAEAPTMQRTASQHRLALPQMTVVLRYTNHAYPVLSHATWSMDMVKRFPLILNFKGGGTSLL